MSSSFGKNLVLTIFGESHGPVIGAILSGLPAGLPVNTAVIDQMLALRRPQGTISTSRVEADSWSIQGGVYKGYTSGSPLVLTIPNTAAHSADYDDHLICPRPSHADYAAYIKYSGYADPRGGGMFSGRLTAPIVAAGAILLDILAKKGIQIGTHVSSIGTIQDRAFSANTDALTSEISTLSHQYFPVLNPDAKEKMMALIEKVRSRQDSVGGILETAITGLEAGIGEPWFDSVESLISHALFSIPAVKGVSFGDGFDLAFSFGSAVNDSFYMETTGEKSVIRTMTNHNGGINGGITNGMPLLYRCAVKPTPSIGQVQPTVNLETQTNTTLQIHGRHDPCIVHRAAPVVNALSALVIADLCISRYGIQWLNV